MPSKRNDSSIIELAIASRWPTAAFLCAACFVGGFIILPGSLSSNVLYRPIAATLRELALFPVFGFGLMALVKYLHEAKTKEKSVGTVARTSISDRSTRKLQPWYEPTLGEPVGEARKESVVPDPPTTWSLPLLQSIEWKRFEEVVAAYFRVNHFRCETVEFGPDGGVDGRLYFDEIPEAVGVFQCKAWNQQVGVGPIRELLGVMTHENVARGYFCATGDFTKEAIAFAAANPIKLITGRDLLDAIARMPQDAQQELLEVSTTGDYATPTCASCGIKLVERQIGGRTMWGCRNFPRCRMKIGMRKSAQTSISHTA